MSKSGNAPRKPATKFPHLRKQMAKNTLQNRQPPKPNQQPRGRKGGK